MYGAFSLLPEFFSRDSLLLLTLVLLLRLDFVLQVTYKFVDHVLSKRVTFGADDSLKGLLE